MKTIYRIFKSVGLALIALWMVSCQDLLTEDPKGQLAVTNFFNSKGDLDLALNGMYSKVASDMYANIWAGFESVMGVGSTLEGITFSFQISTMIFC